MDQQVFSKYRIVNIIINMIYYLINLWLVVLNVKMVIQVLLEIIIYFNVIKRYVKQIISMVWIQFGICYFHVIYVNEEMKFHIYSWKQKTLMIQYLSNSLNIN